MQVGRGRQALQVGRTQHLQRQFNGKETRTSVKVMSETEKREGIIKSLAEGELHLNLVVQESDVSQSFMQNRCRIRLP